MVRASHGMAGGALVVRDQTMLEPKLHPVNMPNGTVKTFILHKFPATDGREIVATYPVANMPKLGEYKVSDAIMLKLMSFVAVQPESGDPIRLTTRDLVNNHVPDWEVLARLELAMMEYNVSFFGQERRSVFLDGLKTQLHPWISKILTGFSEQLSQQVKQPSTN